MDERRGAVQHMSWTNQRVHGLEEQVMKIDEMAEPLEMRFTYVACVEIHQILKISLIPSLPHSTAFIHINPLIICLFVPKVQAVVAFPCHDLTS